MVNCDSLCYQGWPFQTESWPVGNIGSSVADNFRHGLNGALCVAVQSSRVMFLPAKHVSVDESGIFGGCSVVLQPRRPTECR